MRELWTRCPKADPHAILEWLDDGAGIVTAQHDCADLSRADDEGEPIYLMRVPRDEAIKRMAAEYGLQMGGDGAAYSLLMEALLRAALDEEQP